MIIGVVVADYPSLTETFIRRELEALRVVGVETRVFALRGRGTDDMPDSAATRPTLGGSVRGVAAARGWRPQLAGVIRRNGIWRGLRLGAAAAGLAAEARRAGVTHVHAHFAYVTADVALLMARLLGCRYSVSAHAWDIYCTPRDALAGRLTGAAFIATCADCNVEYLRTALPHEAGARVHRIYHGVSLEEAPRQPDDPPLILAVGRLEAKKGYVHLIEACARLAADGERFACRVIGEGPGREEIEAAIGRLGVGGVVTLEGAHCREEVAGWLRRASVLIAPSVIAPDGDRDVIPNVVLEAMASGVPVVASRVSGIPEAVRDGDSGLLVDSGRPDALAAAIRRVLRDPGLASRLSEGGRRMVRSRFDPVENARPLSQLFDGVPPLVRSAH